MRARRSRSISRAEPVTYAVLAFVLVANAAAFAAFGLDKWRSRRGRRRIPEAHLLWLAWATGAAGAWLAVSVFRHKTRKTSFRRKLALVTLLNLGWVLWRAR